MSFKSGETWTKGSTRRSDEENVWELAVAREGLCTKVDPEVMFPSPRSVVEIYEARLICTQCPVIRECALRTLAMKPAPHSGVWASTIVGVSGVHWMKELKLTAATGQPRHVKNPTKDAQYRKRTDECVSCGQAIRPRGVTATQDPNKAAYGARGECARCYSKTQKRERREQEVLRNRAKTEELYQAG